jgi:hypothetical protein
MTLKGKPLQLIATSDIGFFAARAFMNTGESEHDTQILDGSHHQPNWNPESSRHILASQILENLIFKDLTGKNVPTTFRIPVWLMMAAVKDLGVMFR